MPAQIELMLSGKRDAPLNSAQTFVMQEGPQKFTIAPGEAKSFCVCGLSKIYPLCDGTLYSVDDIWPARCGCRGAREPKNVGHFYAFCVPRRNTGSHRAHNAAHGTDFKSIKIEVAEGEAARDVYICRCGHSKNKPFCDGTHKKVKGVPL